MTVFFPVTITILHLYHSQNYYVTLRQYSNTAGDNLSVEHICGLNRKSEKGMNNKIKKLMIFLINVTVIHIITVTDYK